MLMNILLQIPASHGNSYGGLILVGLIFIIMYFFMIYPQQKNKKKIEKQREALKVGDQVILSGGIHGKLMEINEIFYMVEIADGIKIKVNKFSVFAVTS